MRILKQNKLNLPSRSALAITSRAFTLEEVVFSMAIASITIAGIITGHIQTSQRVAWSACSLAAHSSAMQRMEQTRCAKWDTLAFPSVDEVVSGNFPVQITELDVPIRDTHSVVYSTNTVTFTTVSGNPPLKRIQVDSVWPFTARGILFTNTIITYRSPDQ